MPDAPSFAEVFDEALFDGARKPAPPTLDPADVFGPAADDSVGSHLDSGSHEPRFDGDTSQLPPEVCWTLQELVAAPHVTEKAKKHWPIVVQFEQVLRSRLAELGLLLELNHEHRYAFTRQAEDPSPHSRTILRARTLSLAASALALYLYQQYLTSPDDPVVDTTDMTDHMLAYKRSEDTDEAAFHKKVMSAIKSLDEAAVIKPIKGTDRYLIHGVITSILTAERVEALDQRYRAIARGEAPNAIPAADGEDEDE